MIFRPRWQQELMVGWLAQRLALAHGDLTRIAGILRTPSIDVWTEIPTDSERLTPGAERYSLEGWRVHYRNERTRIAQINTDWGTEIGNFEPGITTAMNGYLTSMANINAAYQQIIDDYEDANGELLQTLVAQSDRNTLAGAIEAELET